MCLFHIACQDRFFPLAYLFVSERLGLWKKSSSCFICCILEEFNVWPVTYFDPFFTPFVFRRMVAACTNVCRCRWTIATGDVEPILSGFFRLFYKDEDIRGGKWHFAFSTKCDCISWCNFLACSLVFLNCFRVSKRDCYSFNRSKFLSLWSSIFMITHKDVDQVTNDDDTENKS